MHVYWITDLSLNTNCYTSVVRYKLKIVSLLNLNCAVNIYLWIFNFANDVTEIILRFIGHGKVHIKMNSNYKQISSNPFEIKLKRNSWHLTATQWWLWAYYCNKQFNIVAHHFHLYLETIPTFNFKWCTELICKLCA